MNDRLSEVALLIGGIASSKNPPLLPVQQVVSIKGKHKQTLFLDPRRVKPLPNQPREDGYAFSEESLRALGESIKTAGQMQAVKVCTCTDPEYDAQLYDGERRLLGCTLVEIMIECEVDESIDDTMMPLLFFKSVVSNFGRENHTALEIARACVRLIEEYKIPVTEVAKALGHPTSWVYMHLGLLKLPTDVQALLAAPASEEERGDGPGRKRATRLSRPVATMLLGLPNNIQISLANYIVEHGLSDAEARRIILARKRVAGVLTTSSSHRSKELFQSLLSLVKTSVHRFGIYLDMTPGEINAVMVTHSSAERQALSGQIDHLASCLRDISQIVQKKT